MNAEVKEIAKELEQIGLSEKEAKVYLALLEVGQESVQNISKKANVNRATTYVILESLQKKGIVTTFEQGKKTLFVAEGPSALYNIIREQQEELEKKDNELDGMMPQLMSLYNLHPDKPEVTFYDGKEGLLEMLNDFLNSGAKQAVEFFSLSDVNNVFSPDEINPVGKKRREMNIEVMTLFTDESKNETEVRAKVHQDNLTKSIEVSPREYPFSSDIIVYKNKVWLASLRGHISGVIIENQEIADTIKNIFNLAYKGAKKISE